MLREYLTNKWVLSAIGFLIVFSVVCVLWYRYDIAHDKQQLAKEEEMLRQRETSQKTDTNITTKEETNIPAKSDIPTTDGPLTDKTLITPSSNEISSVGEKKTITVNLDGKEYQIPAISNLPTISPHGFGEFPEVPKDYNDIVVWNQGDYYNLSSEAQRQFELLDRVLIKLWTSGERNFKGGIIDGKTDKVYPNYFNTVYITVKERVSNDGIVVPHITLQHGKVPVGVDILNPPSNITVLDYESSGIDPFQYLDLPHK